jgi:hypothetical protein
MRRYVPLLIAGIALIVSGCRDTAAPRSEPLATLVPVEDQSFSRIVSSTEGTNASEIKFTFSRAAGSAQIGEFTLTWEDNSVCERDNSGYGWEFFRQACQAENEDIEMTARVWTEGGRAYVDFYPDIRFSPAKNVILKVNRPQIVGQTMTLPLKLKYNIYYTYRLGDTRYFIDEAWFDPEQRTNFNTTTGDVWREIRHFSGFVIRTGYDEAPVAESVGTIESQ